MSRFICLVFLSIAACASAGKQSFDSGNYVVEWKTLPETKEIEFNITAKTTGWVGLGISKENKDMKKLDVVVGGVDGGKQYLWDMYADDKKKPTEDTQKDAKFVSGSESNGVTNLSFKRKLDTGDASKDNAIQADESYYLAWAHGSKDTFEWHGSDNRGYSSAKIKLVSISDLPTTVPTTFSGFTVVSTVPPTTSNSTVSSTVSTKATQPSTTAVASAFSPAFLVMTVTAAAFYVLSL